MNPLALLKLISPREWLFAAIAALAIGGAIHFYRAGEAHVKAADARAVAAQQEKVNVSEQLIGDRIAQALAAYQANNVAPPAPPAPVPHLVCHNVGSGSVPGGQEAAGGGNGAGTGPAVVPAQADAGFDPAPAISATGTEVDARITHYVAKIRLLQAIIRGYQDGGVVAR